MKKLKTNKLYYYANDYRKHLTEEDEIESIDMTNDFNDELKQMIQNGEIIIININGKMRLGKSTVAMALGQQINQLLNQQHKTNQKFGMNNICRDQQEHSKRIRNPKLKNTILVVDESSELEKTGENVTTENALRQQMSDVQAGRYIHAIFCSPKETIDPNADIMLSVIAIDPKEEITRCKLYYKYYEGGSEYTQLLGFIDISVKETIKEWKKVKKIFYKDKKTPQEEQELLQARKKDFYCEYMVKKYEKMELITKEGIFKPRLLDYADVILKATNKLKILTKQTNLINPNITRNYVKKYFREAKIPTSILGEELATREVMGILDLYKAFHKITYTIDKFIKSKKNKEDKQLYEIELHNLKNMQKEILEAINLQEKELIKYKEINEKYHEVIK